MMTLILGGSGSGKSAYAEETAGKLAEKLSGGHSFVPRYYLATMQASGREGQERVQRHKRLRSGKGFDTIEQSVDIHRTAAKMNAGPKIALLECVSNLTANEMFSGEKPKPEKQVAEKIIREIGLLEEAVTHLVVVSNNIFEDGTVYDAAMTAYIRAMGSINRRLAAMAGQVVEVAAGIPIFIKQ